MNDLYSKRRLPHRDWILLPLASVLTVLVLAAAAEGLARVFWSEQPDACIMAADGAKPKANCSSMVKAAEGPRFEARYNECSYRATGPCRQQPPVGTERIAVVGTSTAFGVQIPFDNVWFMRTAQDITARCGRPVDVQSLVQVDRTPGHLDYGDFNVFARRLPEVIALKPKFVVLVVAAFDLVAMPDGGFNATRDPAAVPPTIQPGRSGVIELAKSLKDVSRAVSVAQHFIYGDTNLYVWTFLHYGDRAEFLHSRLTPRWQERVAYVDNAVSYISGQLKSAGIPLVVAYAPAQVEAYLIADKIDVPDVDGEAMGRTVGAIAQRHGAVFADGASAFQGVHNVQDYFYRADGHLNSAGNQVFGDAVAGAVMSAKSIGYCQREAMR
jgi:hypothetical protein